MSNSPRKWLVNNVMLEQLKKNLTDVRQKIDDAAKRSGRSGSDITLVGVTKYVDAEVTRVFFEAGCNVMGENRPQNLWDKAEQLSDLPIEWHMIGNLQRNKVKRTVEYASLIHSADSIRLLDSIQQAAVAQGTVARVLLEINVSGESAKHGFAGEADRDSIREAIAKCEDWKSIRIEGLMAMAGLEGNLDDARREFCKLRDLRDALREEGCPGNVTLDELSMGMSGDFEVAIGEGATIVRVGSALFEGVR